MKKKLNIDAISLLGCLEARRRRVGGCDLWPFVGWISLEIGGGRRRGERDRVSHRECVDPRKMQSLSQSRQSWNTLIVHTGQISGGLYTQSVTAAAAPRRMI